MIAPEQTVCRPEVLLYALNTAAAASLASGLGLAIAWACRRRSAPLRHGILFSVLVMALLSPMIAWLSQQTRIGCIGVSLWQPAADDLSRPSALEPSASGLSDELETARFGTLHAVGDSPEDGHEGRVAAAPPRHPPPQPAKEAVGATATPAETSAQSPESGGRRGDSAPSWLVVAGTLLVIVWGMGVMVNLALLGRGLVLVARLRRRCKRADDPRLQRIVRQAARVLGLRHAPAVVVSPCAPTPMALGLFRPAIVLPKGLEQEAADGPLEALLVHELAHVTRGDHWTGLAQRLAAVLYWWNPLVHRINDHLAQAREEICDNYVLRTQANGYCFAEMLFAMAARIAGQTRLPAALGVLEPKLDGLDGRIARLLNPEEHAMTRMKPASLMAVAAFATALGGLLLISSVRGEGKPEGKPQDSEPRETAREDGAAAAIAETAQSTERTGSVTEPLDALPNKRPLPAGARVTLILDRAEYVLGENIAIGYRLENVGTEVLLYEKGAFFPASRQNDGYQVTAVPVDKNGKQIGKPLEGIPLPEHRMGRGGGWQLKPGETHEQTLYLPRYVRLEKPGRYRVRVGNHNRLDPKQQFSAGETTITLKVPTPQEARELYQQMKRLPRGPVAEIGERRDALIADFQGMIHPAYRPILQEYARNGDSDALEALGKMHTVPATEALVGVISQALDRDAPDFALAAYKNMADRLPDPQFFRHEKTDPNMHQFFAKHRDLVERTWRPEYAKTLRRLASLLTRDRQAKALEEICIIFKCVGTADDIADLTLAYTKAIEATKTLPFETHQYFRPRGVAYGYRFAVTQLLERGAKPSTNPQTPGEAAVYLLTMSRQKDFRPKDWPEQVIRWLGHENPYMRELVLELTPEPIPEAALQLLPKLLADPYVDLQIAACRTAAKHPREAFREPIRSILKKGTEEYLLNAATAAAAANGIATDQVMEIWLSRIDNADLGGKAVVRLLLAVLDDNRALSQDKLEPETLAAIKARWSRFIQEHRQKLQKGHRFKIGDPEITPDLFPRGFQFHDNGKPWPPGTSGDPRRAGLLRCEPLPGFYQNNVSCRSC